MKGLLYQCRMRKADRLRRKSKECLDRAKIETGVLAESFWKMAMDFGRQALCVEEKARKGSIK